MRNTHLVIALLAILAWGCDNAGRQVAVAPSTVPAASTTVSEQPRMSPPSHRDRQPDVGNVITLGQVISSHLTADDPICGDRYPFRCRYFRLPVPEDGILEVTIRWSATQRDPYPLDMDVVGPSGAGWVGMIANGPHRVARGRATGGSTYVIELWSFLTPDEPFELTTSLQQH